MENTYSRQESGTSGEQTVDLTESALRLWRRRRFILTAAAAGAAVGLAAALSIPNEYSVTVTLAPESGRPSSGGLAGAATVLGLGPAAQSAEADALNITLFPEILASDPFALGLYTMEVTTDRGRVMPLSEYVSRRRRPWWSRIASAPAKAAEWIKSQLTGRPAAPHDDLTVGNPFRLTVGQTERMRAIKGSMSASADKKSGVTSITVRMQDPLVAATVADSVVARLQACITGYRTKKAVDDYACIESLCRERQAEYYAAQQRYAAYADGNASLYTRRSMVEGERLQNDMNQAYQIYTQVASQLQTARARIQEAKPVFAVVNPATVPVRASSPRRARIVLAFAAAAAAAAAAWVLLENRLRPDRK